MLARWLARWTQTLLLLQACFAYSFHAPFSGAARGGNAMRGVSIQMAGFGSAPSKKPTDPFKKPKEAKKLFEAAMRRFNEHRGPRPFDNQVDVYVKADGERASDKFFFVGKAVARMGSTDDYAVSVLAQKRLVLEHAKLLQRELKAAKKLQLWVAPPNSEVRVAQRQVPLRSLADVKFDAGALSPDDVGFAPEQYTAEDRDGFYVRLPPNGIPVTESDVRIVPPEELETMNIQGLNK